MEFVQAVVLGVVQGITEFLPVSSDGHLILVPSLLGWERFGLGFDVVLHVGTLLATVLYFRDDVTAMLRALVSRDPSLGRQRHLVWMVMGATVPSVIVVLGLEPFIEGVELRSVEQQIVISAVGLLVTAVVLGVSEVIARAEQRAHGERRPPAAEKDSANLTSWKALAIGFAQGFAALPGVSRSGLTIASGQALGFTRGESARFSFLLSIPIITLAMGKKSLDLFTGAGSLPPLGVMLVGITVTTVVGYAAIGFLLPFVRKHSLWWFSAYTAIAGILLLVVYAV